MMKGRSSLKFITVFGGILLIFTILAFTSASAEDTETLILDNESLSIENVNTEVDLNTADQADTKTKNIKDVAMTPDALADTTSAASSTAGDITKLPDAPEIPDNAMPMGAATYKVPIAVPPGRLGMTPEVNLIYNSFQRNGWIGVGWELDMGSIQRNTKWLDYSKNDFVFTINGSTTELVPNTNWGTNYYQAKIDDGKFTKYYKNPSTDGWEVTAKDGTKYYYGKTPYDTTIDSRQTNTHGTFKWCLTWIQDTNGNYIKITYTIDQGEIYLSRIDYTGNKNAIPNLPPSNYVQFNLENIRTDIPIKYNTFSSVRTAYRLKEVDPNNRTVV